MFDAIMDFFGDLFSAIVEWLIPGNNSDTY